MKVLAKRSNGLGYVNDILNSLLFGCFMRNTEIVEIPENLLTALEDLSLSVVKTREAVQIVTSAVILNKLPESEPNSSEHDLN